MKTWIITGLSIVVVLVGTFLVFNKVSPIGWGWWGTYNTSSGLALKGFDPVTYFNNDPPTEGNSQFTYDWAGATWQFSSAENKELFSNNPESYAPQFGGYCSFAVSKGLTADISPDSWHIEGEKLYVFADDKVKADWVSSIGEGSLKKSAENWTKR